MMQIDKESDTWKVIDQWLNKEIAQAQKDNMEAVGHNETTWIRSRYRTLIDIKNLATPKFKEEITLPDYT
jgi:hypothetical protein